MTKRNPTIICDLDGTLCDTSHRIHYLAGEQGECHNRMDKDWDSFNEACIRDKAVPAILALLKLALASGWNVAFSTGRSARYVRQTRWWLAQHGLSPQQNSRIVMMMRGERDFRPDTEVKYEHYAHSLVDLNVIFVLEDRDRVVEFWRSLGLVCLQVKKGEY